MNDLHDLIIAFEGEASSDKELKFDEICQERSDGSCNVPTSPLEFYRDGTSAYDLSSATDDATLLSKIQTGKGDATYYPGNG